MDSGISQTRLRVWEQLKRCVDIAPKLETVEALSINQSNGGITMIKQWELMEQFKKQDEKFKELRDRYWEKERDAKEHVQTLRSQYDACVHRELKEGKDCTAEKGKLRTQIVDAEKAAELAVQERVQVYQFISDEKAQADRITIAHLAEDYRLNQIPAIRAAEVDPIIARLKDARAAYFNAVLDLHEVRDRYQPFYSQFNEMVYNYYKNGQHGAHPHIPHVFEDRLAPFIHENELVAAQSHRRLPTDVARVVSEDQQ